MSSHPMFEMVDTLAKEMHADFSGRNQQPLLVYSGR